MSDDPRIRKGIREDFHTEEMVRMIVSHENRVERLAAFQNGRNDAVRIGARERSVDEHGVLFALDECDVRVQTSGTCLQNLHLECVRIRCVYAAQQ